MSAERPNRSLYERIVEEKPGALEVVYRGPPAGSPLGVRRPSRARIGVLLHAVAHRAVCVARPGHLVARGATAPRARSIARAGTSLFSPPLIAFASSYATSISSLAPAASAIKPAQPVMPIPTQSGAKFTIEVVG